VTPFELHQNTTPMLIEAAMKSKLNLRKPTTSDGVEILEK
jgi:hypothetical protein